MRKLRCGVIGVGYMGEAHARVFQEYPLTELRTIIDVDESRASEVGANFDATHVHTDVEGGLSAEPLDLVAIATPKDHHVEPTRQAMENGCHVLLEKPIAATEEDAREIGSIVNSADTTLAIGYLLRFDPRYAQLKEAVSEFGTVLAMHGARITNASVYRRASPKTHPIYYLAVHDIDMFRWYVESEVVEVYASTSNGLNDGDGPGVIHSILTFQNGTVASLESNWVRPDAHPSHRTEMLRITGTAGYGEIDMDPAGDLPIVADDSYRYCPTSELHGASYGPLRNQVEHVAECIRAGSDPMVTWEDGLHSLRVANAIKTSIDSREVVSLVSS